MERINLIFNVINTLILVLAGVLGYFFIEAQRLEESKSNVELATSQMTLNQAQLGVLVSEKITKELDAEFASINEILNLAKKNGEIILNLSQTRLNETNSELAKLQLDLERTNAKLDTLSKKSNISIDISKLINDIQPVLKVSCSLNESAQLELRCNHENVGSHKVYLSKPEVKLYELYTNKIIENSKYKLSGVESNVICPGISGSKTVYIKDIGNYINGDYVIEIRWDAYLHQSVKEAVYPLLKDVLAKESLDVLTKQGYTVTCRRFSSN